MVLLLRLFQAITLAACTPGLHPCMASRVMPASPAPSGAGQPETMPEMPDLSGLAKISFDLQGFTLPPMPSINIPPMPNFPFFGLHVKNFHLPTLNFLPFAKLFENKP